MTDTGLVPLGVRCMAASRAHFWWPGDPPKPEALELQWDDGSTTVFDTNSDWTLSVSMQAWRDPFEGVDVNDPSWDLGRWTKEPVAETEPLGAIIGDALRGSMPRLNEVGEFVGLDLQFGAVTLRIGSWGGDLTVEVLDR